MISWCNIKGDKMKNLFIDSNIWLSLYDLSKNDLEQFEKLNKLIGKEIRLFIPQQVCDEVYRNRDAKLDHALKKFNMESKQWPAFCKAYTEYKKISVAYSQLQLEIKKWKMKIDKDIEGCNLAADKAISKLFEIGEILDCTKVVDQAYTRYIVGNPPGKDNKYGDAINWECLLKYAPKGENIYIISADKDYCSSFNKESFDLFLNDEWKRKKESKVFFFNNLVDFLSKHTNDIKLETEEEKSNLIRRLSLSQSFETTHGIIAMLNKHSGWTISQIDELCATAQNNSQVAGILSDTDVSDFYYKIIGEISEDKNIEDHSSIKVIMEELQISEQERLYDTMMEGKAESDDALEEYYKH